MGSKGMNIASIIRSDYLKLVPILALAFYIAFIPHQNYPYPVHLDEWNNLAYSQALIRMGSITYPNPFHGGIVPAYPNWEVGFHTLWAVFHQISGLPWLVIFRYFPGAVFMITILSVYTLARREGFGWEAAFFTTLIPTGVGTLGPAFMVPVALGLVFIPLCLFIVFNFTGWRAYAVFLIFVCFFIVMHMLTALGLVIILIPYILFNIKGNFRHSLWIALALLTPFLVSLPWTLSLLAAKIALIATPVAHDFQLYYETPSVIQTYGYFPTGLCFLGFLLLAVKGGKKELGLILGLLALLVMLVTFFTFHYGEALMYYRGLVYMMLIMSIVAGAGLMGVRRFRLPAVINTRVPLITKITEKMGIVIYLVLIGVILMAALPDRQGTRYYHMIDDEDYQTFIWIKENVDAGYDRAILDPWKATAFSAITGRYVYTNIGDYPRPRDIEAYDFLASGCDNTTFLKNNAISIVYTRESCDNPDLVKVREYVYILKEAPVP
jgi:MFS family permease